MVALVLGLAFHITEVGYVGLGVAIIITTFNGIIEEHEVGAGQRSAFSYLRVLFYLLWTTFSYQQVERHQPLVSSTAGLAFPYVHVPACWR
jgi:Na+/H+ antiporter NhaB